MKTALLALIATTAVLILNPQRGLAGLCDDPLRDSFVCYNMHHLRTQTNLLGEQRDLMRVDYPFLIAVAQDMKQIVSQVLEKEGHEHLVNLQAVATLANDVVVEAQKESGRALEKANLIQKQCQTCHQSEDPDDGGGYKWDKISKFNWDYISKKCNEPKEGRNPYLCKHMYGMFKVVDYFWSGVALQQVNNSAVIKTAQELKRIAMDLDQKRMVHLPGQDVQFFQEVIESADEIIQLAEENSPLLINKMQAVTNGCMKCHGVN